MSSYICSNANRFYTAQEAAYGEVPTITAANRIPALKLTAQQQIELANRKDKTGCRTFAGSPAGGRRRTLFELRTYLTSWSKTGQPAYGALFESALGGTPLPFAGGTVAISTAGGRIGFSAAHGLSAGQAVNSGGELRFVSAIVDTSTVQLNAPFTVTPAAGAAIGATVTYVPATDLPSVSIFDYWDPPTAVQRILCGCGVDRMEIQVNGDYHEMHFKGVAQDVIDNASFQSGQGALTDFPAEPALTAFDYSIVPGNLGEAWIGTTPTEFFTITDATVVVENAIETRAREFGSSLPRAIAPGQRSVTAAFDLYAQTDEATIGLYQAARQESPVSVLFQLGNEDGHLLGVYLKSVVPEVPEFNDGGNRLQWRFRPSRAQGTMDDEIAVALG